MKPFARALALVASALLLSIMAAACTPAETETRRLVPDGQACPSTNAVLKERPSASAAKLTAEERLPLTPLCWYRLKVRDAYMNCQASDDHSYVSLEYARQTELHAFDPSYDAKPDTRLGRVLCTSDGPVLVLQGTKPTCEAFVDSDSWDAEQRRGVKDWQEDHMEASELWASDDRPTFRVCVYELETK